MDERRHDSGYSASEERSLHFNDLQTFSSSASESTSGNEPLVDEESPEDVLARLRATLHPSDTALYDNLECTLRGEPTTHQAIECCVEAI